MRRGASERGVALVVVLLLLAVMSILVAEFAYAVRIQAALLANHEARVKGRAAANAGQNAAAAILQRAKPDDPNYFNNPTTGIMLFRYQCMTGGNTDSFLAVVGGADFTSMTAEERAKAAAQTNASSPTTAAGGTAGQEGCGRWSLGLPYQLGDTNLDIEIADEQSRLNLNAMVTSKTAGGTPGMPGMPGTPGTPGTPGATPGAGGVADVELSLNRPYFCAVYELIRLQVIVHKLQISDSDIFDMTNAIVDYLDYGKIDGTFDRDKIATFEIDDRIVPMKDGPLDTVDEIRLVPGMTDELYDAIKDFFTVYPVIIDINNPSMLNFNQEVNLNAAPLEVIYALIRGTTDSGERCEASTITEEEAMKKANLFIQSNFPANGTGAAGGAASGAAAAAAAATGFNINRDTGILPPPVAALNAKPGMARFYRVKVNAMMPDGQETTITRVIRATAGLTPQPLYYREE